MAERRIKLDNWRETYERKLVSLEEAARVIESGQNIFIPSSYSGEMPKAIVARKDELRGVTVEISSPINDPGWLSPGMEESFEIIVRTYLFAARKAHDEGRISFMPYTNGSYFKPYRDKREGIREIDVLLMEVSPPDENGFMSFGINPFQKRSYSGEAKVVIAEIDRHMITTRGNSQIHVSETDCLVDISAPALEEHEISRIAGRVRAEKQDKAREALSYANPRPMRNLLAIVDDQPSAVIERLFRIDDPDDDIKAMAGHLKTVLRDQDTIQIGTGSISRHMVELGVFDELEDLGIWSEVGAPGMGDLIKRGIATGKYSTHRPGKAVFASITGMRGAELKWAHNNPLIELHPAEHVINITNISQIKNMVAINNVTQVDMTGQITCETQFGLRLINGPGGQPEFHIGAFLAPGGRAVSLLRSTWGAEKAVSTIVPFLDYGSMVSIPRYFSDIIITEYGAAELVGKTHRQRAEALISIAHPDFRAELEGAVKDIG
ncbi:MAG: acetyl-CoA hydrolase/transferase C-terminal domain-containing protein [Candidatus Adiutricales bacterium]